MFLRGGFCLRNHPQQPGAGGMKGEGRLPLLPVPSSEAQPLSETKYQFSSALLEDVPPSVSGWPRTQPPGDQGPG